MVEHFPQVGEALVGKEVKGAIFWCEILFWLIKFINYPQETPVHSLKKFFP